MSLTSGFILLFILYLPGIIFNMTYSYDPVKKKNLFENPGRLILYAVIPAIAIHSLGFLIIENLTPFLIDFKIIGFLAIGADNVQNFVIENVAGYIRGILFYFFGISLASYFLAVFLRKIVWRFRLDLEFSFLKFHNEWFYIFYGDENRDADLLMVEVFADIGDGHLVFSGILTNYYFDKNSLDRVQLSNVAVRKVKLEGPETSKTLNVGRVLIPYNKISSIHITGYTFDTIENNENEVSLKNVEGKFKEE